MRKTLIALLLLTSFPALADQEVDVKRDLDPSRCQNGYVLTAVCSGACTQGDFTTDYIDCLAAPAGGDVDGIDAGTGTTRTGENKIQIASHDTDCTSLTDGVAREFCFEEDSDAIFVCQPTSGGCDTAAEWVPVRAVTSSFFAHKSGTDQSGVASATPTKVTFGSESWDLRSDFASDRFTPSIPAIYNVTCTVNFTSSMERDKIMYVSLYDGSSHHKGPIISHGDDAVQGGAMATRNFIMNGSTDYVECWIYHAMVGSQTIEGNVTDTYFTAIPAHGACGSSCLTP